MNVPKFLPIFSENHKHCLLTSLERYRQGKGVEYKAHCQPYTRAGTLMEPVYRGVVYRTVAKNGSMGPQKS
jgi:hypothetical protein